MASFAANIVLAHTDPRGDFYLPVTRFWELGLGCLLAVMGTPKSRTELGPGCPQWQSWLGARRWVTLRLRPAVAALGLMLICIAAFSFDPHRVFPGWAAVIPVAGAVCIIGAAPGDWLREHVRQ